MQIITIPFNPCVIEIARQGENKAVRIDFDLQAIFPKVTKLSSYTVTLDVQLPQSATVSSRTLTHTAEHIASWLISSSDTASKGAGRFQITISGDGVIAKSDIYNFTVKEGMTFSS